MKAYFILSGRRQTGQLVRENPLTIIVRVTKGLGHKFIKRHRIRYSVEVLRGRRDLDIGIEERTKRRRKDLKL